MLQDFAPHFTFIKVNRIANRLECIEGDSHRKHQLQSSDIQVESYSMEGIRKTHSKEVIVFEKSQDDEIYNNIQCYITLPFCNASLTISNDSSRKICHECSEAYQKKKTPIYSCIEYAAGKKQHCILQQVTSSCKPI